MEKKCLICGEAHGYTQCPEPLRFPSSPRKEGESVEKYEKRLRFNRYMRLWMQLHPEVKQRRQATLKVARVTDGDQRAKNERERSARKLRLRRDLLQDLKRHPCMDCGGSFPACVMDYDHRDPKTKDKRFKSPGGMFGRTTKEAFFKEIEKCDLVCANCHRIRTHLGRGHRRA